MSGKRSRRDHHDNGDETHKKKVAIPKSAKQTLDGRYLISVLSLLNISVLSLFYLCLVLFSVYL